MSPGIPAPHLVLRNFLSAEENDALLAWALANEERFKAGGVGGDVVDLSRRRCEKLSDLGPSRAVLAARVEAECAGWLQQLKVTPFVMDKLELEMVAYRDQAHFAFHMDAALGKDVPARKRRLTAVYYFYREPKEFSGGELRLYNLGEREGSDRFTSIAPEQNMLLVFPSWVGHDVTRVECSSGEFGASRFAVNCWVHQPA